jgi:hypothetical protein
MESKEHEILLVMRKVLTSIIKEITPESGQPYPLTEETVYGIRDCLKLLTLRERELADAAGMEVEKPFYKGRSQPSSVSLPVSSISGKMSDKDD